MADSLKIVADQQITLATEAFSSFGDVSLVNGRHLSQADIIDADVLLVRSVTSVNQTLLANSKIKFVGSATSGTDHIDTNYLANQKIEFHYAPGSNARSVAEYVLSALLSFTNQFDFSLKDKTIGIIGVGNVGSSVHSIMRTLGLKCLLNDPPRANSESDFPNTDLDELCNRSDIVTVHTPLIEAGSYKTRDLIDKNLLNFCHEDVVIINTSRGAIINESDLLSFKQSNPYSKLILDVWQNEPDINLDLLKLAEIATPHIAGYSFEGKLKATQQLQKALSKWSGINVNPISNTNVINIECEKTLEDEVLYDVITQSYDVHTDSIQLKTILEIQDCDRADNFDQLRKNYPIRHEFEQISVKMAVALPVLIELGYKQQ
ncbi:MAG: 4-phosphoerythronate dehydrogenase [Pseudomonadota bacterium]